MILSSQIRAGRSMLGWSQTDLAKAAGVSRPTINDLENDTGDPRRSSILAVQGALEVAGVEFTNGDTPGVRIKKRAMSISPEDGEFQIGVQKLPDGRVRGYFQIVPRGFDPIGHEHDVQLFETEPEANKWLHGEAARRGFKKIVRGSRRPK